MREKMYRAWNKEKQAWFYVHIGQTITDLGRKIYHTMCIDGVEWFEYTGFKDKNGKEVYEGDVVKFTPKNDGTSFIHDFSDGSPMRRQIKWDEKYGCLTFAYINGNTRTSGFSFEKHNLNNICEVVGNIHENPELLEEDL